VRTIKNYDMPVSKKKKKTASAKTSLKEKQQILASYFNMVMFDIADLQQYSQLLGPSQSKRARK
jgi:hypothetical protein